MMKTTFVFSLLTIIFCFSGFAQKPEPCPEICTPVQLDSLLQMPQCLKGYRTNQGGYLTKIDSTGKGVPDTTFSIEQFKVPTGDILINGWLYLPFGKKKYPLIILTNGGGNNTAAIRSFSDWLAPALAHCGIAAFVHDKRGTGASGGDFVKTTYDDYINDAGMCAVYFSKHASIDTSLIGVAGASEGGRVAIIAASRFKEIKFVVSFEGTVVSAVDDRINAQKGWLKSLNLPDSAYEEVFGLHCRSIRAWASQDAAEHMKVNSDITEMRKKYEANILPWKKEEMDSIPDFANGLPTWYSLHFDYMSEMRHFNKKWLALFGEKDAVVPTEQSIENTLTYMKQSGNKDYLIAVIPDCGHGVLNLKTKEIIRVNHIIINWVKANVL